MASSINVCGTDHSYELTPSPSPQAPTLVFIHGWLLSRVYWRPVVQALAPLCRCLSYDLRGFGESNQPHSPGPGHTPAAYAEDLACLLQELKITGPVWLVGHSLGGTIALWGAERLPHLVKGVICLNAGGGIYLKEEFERFRSAGQELVKRRPSWLRNLPLLDLLFARAMVAKPLDRFWGRQRIIDFVNADATAALGTLLDCTTEAQVHKLPQIVSQLSQPVYFLAGQRDQVMELKYVHHLASFHYLFQSGQNNVLEIANCGHMAMLEYPEQVAQLIRAIIRGEAP